MLTPARAAAKELPGLAGFIESYKPLVALPALAGILFLVWLFFGNTWRELDEDAHRHRAETLAAGRMDRRPFIALVLIAVIQGLALTTLAVESETVIGETQWLYWPYVIAGFVLIVNFWTLAITHTLSFISWPFDAVHTILYLLASFVEVTAFAQITHPTGWFSPQMPTPKFWSSRKLEVR